jgi:ubiquinone/menaquinone biosynthesis C-methylase UbiE
MKKLNLGSGSDYKKGWVNVELLRKLKADVHHNLNKFPYPFKNSEFDEVLMKMVLEHIDEPLKALKEVTRISRNGAKLTVIVPHTNSYSNLTDLQHKHNFTENSFNKDLLKEYNLGELELVKKEFLFPVNKWKRFVPFKGLLKIYLNGIYDDILFEFRIRKK